MKNDRLLNAFNSVACKKILFSACSMIGVAGVLSGVFLGVQHDGGANAGLIGGVVMMGIGLTGWRGLSRYDTSLR
jgi:hypothetical protein